MPYVSPADAPNAPRVDLAQVRAEMGPGPWRRPLVGTEHTRCALIAWPSGFRSVPHLHPHAAEAFLVLDGEAVFTFGATARDGQPPESRHRAVPGTLLLAQPGTLHTIEVTGPGDFVFLASVSPNADQADETVEIPDHAPGGPTPGSPPPSAPGAGARHSRAACAPR